MKLFFLELMNPKGRYSSRRFIAVAGFLTAVLSIAANAVLSVVYGIMPVEASIVMALLTLAGGGTIAAGFGKKAETAETLPVQETKSSDVIEP